MNHSLGSWVKKTSPNPQDRQVSIVFTKANGTGTLEEDRDKRGVLGLESGVVELWERKRIPMLRKHRNSGRAWSAAGTCAPRRL